MNQPFRGEGVNESMDGQWYAILALELVPPKFSHKNPILENLFLRILRLPDFIAAFSSKILVDLPAITKANENLFKANKRQLYSIKLNSFPAIAFELYTSMARALGL